MNGPSQESAPEYGAAILLFVMPDAVASIVTLHIGVGTSPPAGKNIVIMKVVPNTVPDKVPVLFLWHDAQVPSVRSTARVIAVPDTVSPRCARIHVNSSRPCESDPVPFHVPLTLSVGFGAAGDIPQAETHTAAAATRTMVIDFMGRPSLLLRSARYLTAAPLMKRSNDRTKITSSRP